MPKILTNKGYRLEKKLLSNDQIKKLKAELTVKPFSGDYSDEIKEYPVYVEKKKYIYVPKFYGIKNFGKPEKYVNMKGEKRNFNFIGTLRDNQVPIVQESMKSILKDKGGILQLHCGCGKTLLGLYLAAQLGFKTLIIVHKSFLLNQWLERIKQFTDAKVGIIRQKKTDVKDKDIVVGMLQSISMKDYDEDIFKGFSTVIYDEVHHEGSKIFSRVFQKVCAKYTIGLSATPIRNDGLTKILFWNVGEIIYKLERKGDKRVIVKQYLYATKNKNFAEKKRWIKGKGIKPHVPRMVSALQKIKERNKFIVSILNILRKQEERKILVLSDRIEHLTTMKSMVDECVTAEVNNGECDEGEYKTDFYIGKMKPYEQREAAEADIIFGTFAMAEEGLDISDLNTLILATPKKKITQCVGRILRKQIKEGDINPLIIDIADQLSVFGNQGEHRERYYNQKKYTVDTYYTYNEKLVGLKEFYAKQGSDVKDVPVETNLNVTLAIDPEQYPDIFNAEDDEEIEDKPVKKYEVIRNEDLCFIDSDDE